MNHHFTITGFADEIGPSLTEQIAVLQANGISHIEIRGIDGENVADFSDDQARAYHDTLTAAGIQVSSLGSPIGKITITDDFAPHLAKFKHVLHLAALFEAPYVRLFSFYAPAGEHIASYQAEVIARWQQFAAAAKAYPQIILLHENEKEIFGETPEAELALFDALADDQVQTAFDPANFVQGGVTVFPHAYDLLKAHIAYVHIKDAIASDGHVVPAGFGDGQVKKVLAALAAADYHGFLSLEPHLAEFGGFAGLEQTRVSLPPAAQGDGAQAFSTAAAALRKLLQELDEAWQ
ncbi:sugar phosphate isomerase/epimerase family protein [Lacticaseibacillus mingshuiensis]|uniref:Sugar phosphate isomerase/epimerase family protein n=1 Tax=Lacticaseibacillus mingshuiensis TaxID=2799574 RepID=A0ABW4CHP9_9LACO|nr:sugar phosphate isomerase/epimerase [Lacticaseibacillus mingshuiensis]